MTEWLLIGLLAGLVVGLAVAFQSQKKTAQNLQTQNHNLLDELRHANEKAMGTQDRMIEQVINMRREGYQTIPEDEAFESYQITAEQEAEWEEQREQGVGGVNPKSLVGE